MCHEDEHSGGIDLESSWFIIPLVVLGVISIIATALLLLFSLCK